jgi:cell division protein FtsZ
MKFDLPKEQSSIIKVFGVGGGGSNAVNFMYKQGITGVDFVVCNTDQQALDISPVPTKIQLGRTLTAGRGAGSLPEVGKNAAIEDIEQIKEILQNNTQMVFITAGMGGGTGTGAAPVIAQIAREMGILTVGIVTMPFMFEGRKRKTQAKEGIDQIRNYVDTLIVINNEKLREMFGNLSLRDAFTHADNVLTTAAKGIAEIITVTGAINVDFEDVRTVMSNSGRAIMGSAKASGENRAINAVESALASPLLNDYNITGARYVLLNITYGNQEILMDEISEITDYIQEASGNTADVIWGHGFDESLGDNISVTLIATGFNEVPNMGEDREIVKKVVSLNDDVQTNLTQPTPSFQPTATSLENKKEELFDEPYIKTSVEAEIKPTFNQPIELPVDKVEPVIELKIDEEVEPVNEVEEISYSAVSESEEVESTNITSKDEEIAEPYLKTAAEETKITIEESIEKKEPTSMPSFEHKSENEGHQLTTSSTLRINRLKELSHRLRTSSGISDLENEPAYKRRNVQLDDTPHSSESQVSRFTLSDDEINEGKTTLRDNNSFLHDNVD